MITLEGERKFGPPWPVRIAIVLFIGTAFFGGAFFPEHKTEPRWIGLLINIFGGLALLSAKNRKYGESKNPLFNKYLEMLALGLMFVPHLWLLRNGQAMEMIRIHPFESIVVPVLFFISYYLIRKDW